MKAIKARVLVEVTEQKRSSVLYRPGDDTFLTNPVISVGDEVKEVKTGDNVVYHKDAGYVLDLDGKKYQVLFQDDILAVVK